MKGFSTFYSMVFLNKILYVLYINNDVNTQRQVLECPHPAVKTR